tara:strand:- start:70 stop:555 length:486 start_codon:yes stop_codon:yes gene_type:complete
MKIRELLIPEFDNEIVLTEKFLKRIPKNKMDWKPHKKSMTLQQLGSHLAEIPFWVTGIMSMDEMVMDDYKPPINNSPKEMVEVLKSAAADARASLEVDDAAYEKNWKMIQGGETVFEMPKYKVLRIMVLNQLPHHRAQLGVYLRLLGESVPSSYGPSADER